MGSRQEGGQLRHIRHRDRPRPAAGRAHDGPAGAHPPVVRRRRRVPRHVPGRDRHLHGELHRPHRLYTEALKDRVPRITEKLTWVASLLTISMGLAILVTKSFGITLF